MIILENEFWKISVSELGAEVVSALSRRNGKEYIWEGRPEIWSGHAPLLFPIVGRHKDDICDFGDGKEYTMKIHGFGRRSTFAVESADKTTAVLTLRDNEATRACYPFAFTLTSTFTLEGDRLTVCRTVRNDGEGRMPFALGEHFGFTVPLNADETYTDYYVEFEYPETQPCWPLNADHYVDQPVPYLENQKKLFLDPHMFDGDARIFTSLRSRTVSLRSTKGENGVTVSFPDHCSLGLWAKPCAPYLCIEPWTGNDSHASDTHDFYAKDNVVVLTAGEERSFTCTVDFR